MEISGTVTPNFMNQITKLTMDILPKKYGKKDEIKLNFIRSKGYDVMIIWESEYLQIPDIIIKKIEDFLYDKN